MKVKKLKRLLGKTYNLPKSRELQNILSRFSFVERLVFALFVVVFVTTALGMLSQVNNYFLEAVPLEGGSISEGVIGTPRFINPLLALSDADRDITALVYSGLMKATPDNGLIPDLAKSYSVSEDGRVYTFILKEDLVFHDNRPLTTDDIEFTIQKVQDPALRSPKRVNWDGVTIEKIDTKTISFTLRQPYAPFLENTTIGILPKQIWRDIDAEGFPFSTYNTDPIGSGPYKVKKIKLDNTGVPTQYTLSSFKKYSLGKPYIDTIKVFLYQNEEGLTDGFKSGEVNNINSISPESAEKLSRNAHIENIPLPRIFGIFFNQNQQPLFTDKTIRRALDTAIDKQKIVDDVLHGYGVALEGPLPPTVIAHNSNSDDTDRITEALEILVTDGWKFNEEDGVLEKKTSKSTRQLAFSITTANIPELKHVADLVKTEWEKLGARVEVKVFESSDLNQNVIRPRRYDSLLFGEIIGRDLDLFAFWHSSQRNDPGLNIALYANITADKLLEDARVIQDETTRLEKYELFQEEVQSDIPAVFLYAPDFIYVVSEDLKNLRLGHITTPSERFLNVHEWYIDTEKIWRIFLKY
ncbi:hypothetical protein COB55_01015 [Candidatus Wolfebacteria bacterium]|nr:MAG: hypothetical protein COB55_01015 [Candidatus Wolfebacteria bacterium]